MFSHYPVYVTRALHQKLSVSSCCGLHRRLVVFSDWVTWHGQRIRVSASLRSVKHNNPAPHSLSWLGVLGPRHKGSNEGSLGNLESHLTSPLLRLLSVWLDKGRTRDLSIKSETRVKTNLERRGVHTIHQTITLSFFNSNSLTNVVLVQQVS